MSIGDEQKGSRGGDPNVRFQDPRRPPLALTAWLGLSLERANFDVFRIPPEFVTAKLPSVCVIVI